MDLTAHTLNDLIFSKKASCRSGPRSLAAAFDHLCWATVMSAFSTEGKQERSSLRVVNVMYEGFSFFFCESIFCSRLPEKHKVTLYSGTNGAKLQTAKQLQITDGLMEQTRRSCDREPGDRFCFGFSFITTSETHITAYRTSGWSTPTCVKQYSAHLLFIFIMCLFVCLFS